MKHFLRELLLIFLLLLFFVMAAGATKPSGSIIKEQDNSLQNKDGEKSIVLYHGFESGMPSGWTQVYLHSPYGENAIWDTRTGAGVIAPGTNPIIGEPDSAAVGNKNLVFQWQGTGHRTRLISNPIDLEFIIHPVLTFYHAQVAWGSGQDRLNILYRLGDTGTWQQLASYNHEVATWTHRSIALNNHESNRFYLALEGVSGWGSGVVIDELTITETGYIPKVLDNFTTEQASVEFIPTGSINSPVLRSQVRVTGNTGDLFLQQFTAQSLNTDDNDIDKVKLYFTETEVFNTDNLLAETNGFTNGNVVFQGINHSLPTGYSYLWVAYDIAQDATHGNFADALIPANGVIVSGQSVPDEAHSPFGRREIYKTIFYDDFETDKGWTLTGEWERDIPQGLGGSHGEPGASFAYIGEKVLGTDLTGLGAYPGDYEPEIDSMAYKAISPEFDAFYYTDIKLSFHRWLNAEFTDKVFIHISGDGGITWQQLWVNTTYFTSMNWTQQVYNLTGINRKERVKIRFSVGPTDATNNFSGWNIDNLVITGTYVTRDLGISEWIGPEEGCGMGDSETIVVRVNNFGANPVNTSIPIGFSLDGGQTWHMDVLDANLAVGENMIHTFAPSADFSVPGRYNVKVKTFWDEDQDPSNDVLEHKIFAIPYITPPYTETFIASDGLWTPDGYRSSWNWGVPFGQQINQAQSGTKAWFTNRGGSYNELEASWLESPCFNFSQMQNPVMEFQLNTHMPELLAGTTLQYSIDEGETWQVAGVMDEAFAWNWYNTDLTIPLLSDNFESPHGWTGNTQGWKRVRAILDPALGAEEKVKFRMVFAGHHFGGNINYWEGIGLDAVSIYESPHDVGVAAFINPGNACELDPQQNITISIENYGLNTITAGTQIPVGIDVNEESPVYEFFNLASDLAPSASASYTFDAVFDLSAEITHTLTAYTMLPGDSDFYLPGVYNDTLTTQITVFGYPEFHLGDDIYTTLPDTVLLDAGNGFAEYLWQDGSANQTFQVTSIHSAFYAVSVTDFNGCQVSDSLEVITRDFQVLAISQPLSDCELSAEEYIWVFIKNSGPDVYAAGTEIPLQIFYNEILFDEALVILAEALHPEQTLEVNFTNPMNFEQVGEYAFSITHSVEDANPHNNTLEASVFVYGYPQPNLGDTLYSMNPSTLVIDAGVYSDYLWQDGQTGQYYNVTNPWSAWYHVTVTDQYGCPGTDSVFVLTYDIEIAEVIEPQEACELTDQEPIGVRLINHGPESFDTGTVFPLVLQYQGEILSEDSLVLEQSWAAGTEQIFYFSALLNMQNAQTYDFAIYQKNRDANTANDTLDFSIIVHGYPDIYLPAYITTDYPETVVLAPGEGYTSYLWQDGSTNPTFQVEAWGEYWVEVSNAFGCTTLAETQVLPELFDVTLFAIAEPLNACAEEGPRNVIATLKNTGNSAIMSGTEFILSYTLEGNATVSQNFTLSSGFLPGSTRNFTFSEPVNINAPGTYAISAEVYYDIDEVPGNNTLDEQIQVFNLPQPNLGGNIYTSSPLDVILNPGDGFESYLWQDGLQEQEYYVQVPNSAVYSVTVTDSNGCQNSDSIELVSYNLSLDSVLAPASNCILSNEEVVVVRVLNEGYDDFSIGATIVLGFETADKGNVVEEFVLEQQWQKNEHYQFVFTNTVDLSAQGIHNFKAFVATPNANPETDTLAISVEVAGLPVVSLGSDIYTSKPDTVMLDAGAGFASYYWFDGHDQQHYSVNSYGWKWVRVTDMYGCVGSDTLYVGFFNDTEILTREMASRVYPNPARQQITIEISEDISHEGMLLEITNVNGARIKSAQVFTNGISRETMDISYLKPGVYFLHLRKENMRKTHKITIIN